MINLTAEKREKEVNEGAIPGILYGPEIESQSVVLDSKEFEKVLEEAGESSIIKLKLDSKEYKVLIKEYQLDPVSDEFVHVDLYQPILTEEVEATVPLEFVGESLAVKNGGILVKSISEVEVSALPEDLPSEIEVSIDGLTEFSDRITVADLVIPKGVKIAKNAEDTVATISAPKTVEEIEEETASQEEDSLFVGEETVVEEKEESEDPGEKEGIEI